MRAPDLLPLLVDSDEGLGCGVPHLLGDLDAAMYPLRGLLGLVRGVALELLHRLAFHAAGVAEVVPVAAPRRGRRGGEPRLGPGPLLRAAVEEGDPLVGRGGGGRDGGGPRRPLLHPAVVGVGVEGVPGGAVATIGGGLLLGREEGPLGGAHGGNLVPDRDR